jgi:hypothetical protein
MIDDNNTYLWPLLPIVAPGKNSNRISQQQQQREIPGDFNSDDHCVANGCAALQAIADSTDGALSMVDLAVGWLLAQPGVSCLLVGASTPEQVSLDNHHSSIEISRQINVDLTPVCFLAISTTKLTVDCAGGTGHTERQRQDCLSRAAGGVLEGNGGARVPFFNHLRFSRFWLSAAFRRFRAVFGVRGVLVYCLSNVCHTRIISHHDVISYHIKPGWCTLALGSS